MEWFDAMLLFAMGYTSPGDESCAHSCLWGVNPKWFGVAYE